MAQRAVKADNKAAKRLNERLDRILEEYPELRNPENQERLENYIYKYNVVNELEEKSP